MLRHDALYPHPDSLITFFANHDVARLAGADRNSLIKLQLAYGLILTLRGIPQLYYGDELGMTGGNDPDNRHDFPGGWPGDANNAFNQQGRTPEQQKLFAYVQSLLRLRIAHPVLSRGRLWHLASDDSAYVFERESDEENVVVAFNNSTAPRELTIPLADTPAQKTAGIVSLFGEAHAKLSAGNLQLTMPPQSLSIFLLD